MPEKHKSQKTARLLLVIFLLGCFLSACGDGDFPEQTDSSSSVSSVESQAESLTNALSNSLLSRSISLAAEDIIIVPEPDPTLFEATVAIPAALYSGPSPTEPLCQLEAGTVLTLRETNNPLWYSTLLEDGTTGYVYGECLFSLSDQQEIAAYARSLSAERLQTTLDKLQACFPEGKYWNHMGTEVPVGTETPWSVTDVPCNHSVHWQDYCNFYNGRTVELFPFDSLCECSAFASFFSDQLFGKDAGFYIFNDPDLLRVGDHIRLREYEHSMVVTGISEAGYVVAEVNRDYEHCLISWSRIVTRQELDGLLWDSEYISRYPLCPDGTGGFTQWPENARVSLEIE